MGGEGEADIVSLTCRSFFCVLIFSAMYWGPLDWFADLWDSHRQDPNILIVFYNDLIAVRSVYVNHFTFNLLKDTALDLAIKYVTHSATSIFNKSLFFFCG